MYELIHENSHYDNDTDKAKLFASLFSKKLTSKNQNITTQIMTNPIYQPRPGSEYINHPFSIHELNNAIQHIKANATSSYDNIHPIWIKNLSPLYKQELLNCYNHAWATSTFPNIWKCSSLIPILKKNKPKHDPQSYRPIMITPVLGKLMEKMIYHRLLWFVEKNNLIPHTQTGFRKHHSSTDAFIVLTNAINESLSKNNVLTAAFLDFEGAYDNVDHQILLVKLTNLGLPPKLVSFIKSFIENRSFIVCVGSASSPKTSITKGLPQGAVLSCLLFSLFLWDMNLPHTNLQYADDLVLWATGNTFEITHSKLQNALFQFEKFSQKSILPTAPTKSKIIQFHHKRNHYDARLTLNGILIPEDNQINYLGLILDQKLNFHLHITNTIKKCYRKTRIIKRLLATPWGCNEKTLIQFYKSYIRPHIDYGLIVYGACAPHDPHAKNRNDTK